MINAGLMKIGIQVFSILRFTISDLFGIMIKVVHVLKNFCGCIFICERSLYCVGTHYKDRSICLIFSHSTKYTYIARITPMQAQVTSFDAVDSVFIISLWFGWWKCIKILLIHH